MTIKDGLFSGLNTGIKTSTLTKYASGLNGSLAGSVAVAGSVLMNYSISGALTGSSALAGSMTGDLAGALAGSGVAAGAFASTAPNLLADFDFSAPAIVGIGGNATFASTYATDEWLLQETSGTYANNVGSETLANTGGLQGQTAAGLYDGTDMVSRNAWESDANTDYAVASGSTAGDSASQDFAFRLVFRVKETIPNNTWLISKYLSSVGWGVYIAAGTLKFFVRNGTLLGVNGPATYEADGGDGAWHCMSGWYDQSAQLIYLKADGFAEVSASTTGTGSITNATGLRIGAPPGGYTSVPGMQVSYCGVTVGANSQNLYDETVVLPGADPTGLLTTTSRDSLISVPVSATQVAHFSSGTTLGTTQLPIGYNANFATGYGLMCNSARTNLIIKSEDINGWTYQSATGANNAGDSPDGFRSASQFTATSANGSVRSAAVTVVASTEYTFSGWLKRNGGSDVAGGLKIYDASNAAFIGSTQAYTAGSAWLPEERTFTTPAGCTSIYCYFQVDTNTESVFAWGGQLNLGDARASYIRTSGATASLTMSDYSATASAGVLAEAAAGEAEILFVQLTKAASINYLTAFSAGTGTGNLRNMYINTGSPGSFRCLVKNSSGSNVLLGNEGTTVLDTEHTGTLKWAGAGLLSGNTTELSLDGTAADTTAAALTTSDTITDVAIGSGRSPTSATNFDSWIQHVKIWDGER